MEKVTREVWVRTARAVAGPAGAPYGSAPPDSGGTATLSAMPQNTDTLRRVLHDSGREMLIALTLYSRSLEGRCRCDDGDRPGPCPVAVVRELLTDEAHALLRQAEETRKLGPTTEKDRLNEARDCADPTLDDRGSPRMRALDVYGTAVEIDSVDASPEQNELLHDIGRNWWLLGRGEDPARLREAKLALVQQCGAAARRVAVDRGIRPVYRQLFAIGRQEPDEQVRSVIVREVGAGCDDAYDALFDELGDPWGAAPPDRPEAPQRSAPPVVGGNGSGGERERRARQRARDRSRDRSERWQAAYEASAERENWNAKTMRAWLLPMLVISAPSARHLGTARDDLERWIKEVTRQDAVRSRRRTEDGPAQGRGTPEDSSARTAPGRYERWAVGLALAKGMKYAANKRPGPGNHDDEARQFLVKQAQLLLKKSEYWYTRLTLVQALTLWALPDDVNEDRPIRGHGADPRALVHEWLEPDRARHEHPLVEAAGRLAVRALETRRPGRFLWIDEVSVAAEVGTEISAPNQQRAHNLWIPPSTGWSSLDPTAQQLLADVLLLVVLSERAYRPSDLMALYDSGQREWSRLPSCLSRDRSRLRPVRAVERGTLPGDTCTDDCKLHMCPYPAKTPPPRSEFSEVFCLRQRDLLRRWQPRAWVYGRIRREAHWQRKVPVSGMRRFWEQMGRRARDAEPDPSDLHSPP